MNISRRNGFFECIAMLGLLWFAGCGAAISPEVLKDVDQSLSFEELLKDPEAFRGKTVLLGGDIIETENFPGKTLIIVLQRPLNSKEETERKGQIKGQIHHFRAGIFGSGDLWERKGDNGCGHCCGKRGANAG